jgi:hypothetical protein
MARLWFQPRDDHLLPTRNLNVATTGAWKHPQQRVSNLPSAPSRHSMYAQGNFTDTLPQTNTNHELQSAAIAYVIASLLRSIRNACVTRPPMLIAWVHAHQLLTLLQKRMTSQRLAVLLFLVMKCIVSSDKSHDWILYIYIYIILVSLHDLTVVFSFRKENKGCTIYYI